MPAPGRRVSGLKGEWGKLAAAQWLQRKPHRQGSEQRTRKAKLRSFSCTGKRLIVLLLLCLHYLTRRRTNPL